MCQLPGWQAKQNLLSIEAPDEEENLLELVHTNVCYVDTKCHGGSQYFVNSAGFRFSALSIPVRFYEASVRAGNPCAPDQRLTMAHHSVCVCVCVCVLRVRSSDTGQVRLYSSLHNLFHFIVSDCSLCVVYASPFCLSLLPAFIRVPSRYPRTGPEQNTSLILRTHCPTFEN